MTSRVETHHQVVALGSYRMELRDNADGSEIAVATRPDLSSPWTITVSRDSTLRFLATSVVDAYMSMINNGPPGVAEGKAGFSTFVPDWLTNESQERA